MSSCRIRDFPGTESTIEGDNGLGIEGWRGLEIREGWPDVSSEGWMVEQVPVGA